MIKVKLVCPYCGSESLVRDGPLYWDSEEQEWVSSGTVYDDITCNDCGEEFKAAAEVEDVP